MHLFSFTPPSLVLLAGLLTGTPTGCRPTDPLTREERQQANLQVVKQLQRCLNGQDWPGVKRLFAGRVRCKGRPPTMPR